MAQHPWSPYLFKSGEPEFPAGQSVTRKALINEGLPLMPYQGVSIFIDVREAEIKLCYGTQGELLFGQQALRVLK